MAGSKPVIHYHIKAAGGQTKEAAQEAKSKSDDLIWTTTTSAITHARTCYFHISHSLDRGWTVHRPTPSAFSKMYICFTMLRSLVAAFVAVAASTSAFTVSPLASHRNCAASHAGSSAPLSMAESNADKIRCVAVLFAVNRDRFIFLCPLDICCVPITSFDAIDLPRDEHDTHLLHTLFPSKY